MIYNTMTSATGVFGEFQSRIPISPRTCKSSGSSFDICGTGSRRAHIKENHSVFLFKVKKSSLGSVRRFEFISGEAQRPWPGLGSVFVFEKVAGIVVEKECDANEVFI